MLLHLLTELRHRQPELQIHAIHVHHGLSHYADSWVKHCRQTCSALNVRFDIAHADLQQSSRTSLEHIAREARYKLLDKLSDNNAVLLVAQHQDDQAETLLLQLMRGAGPKGLSAMSSSGTLASGRRVLRPLLSVTRSELEDYAKSHSLVWIEDESNSDDRFDRNFLRNQVLPLLKSRWPNATKTISRSAALCEEQQLLIESEALQKLQQAKTEQKHNVTLNLKELKDLSPAWFSQIMRLWLRELQIDLPSVAVMQQVYRQTFGASDDAQVNIQLAGFQLRRYNQMLYLVSNTDAKNTLSSQHVIHWEYDRDLFLPHLDETYYLEKSDSGFHKPHGESISVRFGQLSAKFKFQVNRPSKTAKQWFKEWKVPPWERVTVPFFYCGSQLVQIGDNVNLLNKVDQGTDLYTIKCKSR